VATSSAVKDAAADFEEFAQARERALMRIAFLVCGDEQGAEDLLRAALISLARHWERVRHEQPDLFVRRVLYREAVREAGKAGPEVSLSEPLDEHADDAWPAQEVRRHLRLALSEPVWEETDDLWEAEEAKLRREVLWGLQVLTPRQRAVVVLMFFDDVDAHATSGILGCSIGAVRDEARDAVAGLRAALPPGRLDDGTADQGADLRDLLELASEALPSIDLAEDAWEEARRRHRTVVRRTVLGVGAMTAAGMVLTVVLREPPTDAPLPIETAPTAAGDGRLTSVEASGVSVFLAPDARSEALLPRYPGADELRLPRQLGPGDPSTWAVLGKGGLLGVTTPVRAAFLVGTADGASNPVLYVPGARAERVHVPGAVVEADPMADHPRAIADDRHRVVFLQGNRIVVLDARDGSLVDVDVPEPTLRTAGWAHDGATVIVQGRYDDWIVDPRRRTVRPASAPVYPDWAELSAGDRHAVRNTFSRTGALTGTVELAGPLVVPNGASVAGSDSWVAATAYLPGDYQRAAARKQGLVAVHGDLRPTLFVLAAAQTHLATDRCYRALAWAQPGVVLFESRSVRPGFDITVRRILAWDVLGERLWMVADIDREAEGAGGFSGFYAA
jgi:DNA-directed RNA polymerase specialized sigma24 family protein